MNLYRQSNGAFSWGSLFATVAGIAGALTQAPIGATAQGVAAVVSGIAGTLATKLP
jgi:hypothetical protein